VRWVMTNVAGNIHVLSRTTSWKKDDGVKDDGLEILTK